MQDLKALSRQGIDEIFHKKNLEYIDKFYSQDLLDHSLPEGATLTDKKQQIQTLINAIPDIHFEYHFFIQENNTVAGRFTLTGTHTGDLFGITPTHKKIAIKGHDFVRYEEDKVVEHWLLLDEYTMMKQLGLIK